MTAGEVLRQLRRFLLLLSVMLFIGTLFELVLVGHTADAVQWLAFGFCAVGLLAVLTVFVKQSRITILVLRICMLVVILGSAFGIYEHVVNNIAFEREINPNASTGRLASRALTGANPLLAPGILSLAALLALGATYRYSVTDNDGA